MLCSKYCMLVVLFSMQVLWADSNLVVIVSKDTNLETLSKKDISTLFLSQTKELPNGQKAITLELNDRETKAIFYEQVSGKSLQQLKKYWATVIFTGIGQPPKVMQNAQEIIDFIQENTNAIAYLPKKDVLSKDIHVILELE